ncbi:thioredoxin family protein [Larkinella sp. VNQ87]|uniref:thioredoxin family protein n=1 Tax=Larkinella sp. VNQ87 TaxID=3400921 RepID=UPI003C038994
MMNLRHTNYLKPLPLSITAASSVLLFFIPSDQPFDQQNDWLRRMADTVQQQFGDQVRVLKIDADAQADVLRSFRLAQLPAFVLVRQGQEVWRQEGLPEAPLFTVLSKRLQRTD